MRSSAVSPRPALRSAAAALYLLNPATIYISASGAKSTRSRAASRCWRSTCCCAATTLHSASSANARRNARWAGSSAPGSRFGYSLLIKPQAAVLLPLLLAFAFVDPARRRERLIATRVGIVAALLLALRPHRTVPSQQSGRGVRLAARTLRVRLERLSVQHASTRSIFGRCAGTIWVPDSQSILGPAAVSLGPCAAVLPPSR